LDPVQSPSVAASPRIGRNLPDVAIVGAGIVGAACAEALARAGLRVEIYESSFAGGGTTARPMGHIVVMDDSEAQLALTRRSRELWSAFAEELPTSCEDVRTGTIWVAADDEEMAHVRAKALFYRGRGVAAEILSAADLAREEPNLRPGLGGGLLVPDDRVLYPPVATRWLIERALARGARLHAGVEVAAIGDRCVQLASGGPSPSGVRAAGAVINAAGFAAPRLTPGLPIEPRKGHLVITDRYPGFCRRQLVELGYLKSAHTSGKESVAFNVQPRATGQLLIGSSREFVGLDESINRPLRERMLRRALEYMPGLARLSALRTWTGFRPATPDNLPLIGAWEPAPGLYIAAGHEGLGITTATGTAELLADLILGTTPRLDPTPFSPQRRTEPHHA
jgi:glycine/D-amino acid oxidase-like deaminating enzyme